VAEAMKSRRWWSYLVLTFRQREWANEWAQARAGVACWSKLRKRMVREFGPMAYVQTWERHKKKGFHVNVAVANQAIHAATIALASPARWQWLRDHAEASGFGYICWAEPLRGDDESLAGYMTKLSRELTGAGPKNQVPTQAPPHFRRLRASQGLLQPPHKSDYTGRLVQCTIDSMCGVSPATAHERKPTVAHVSRLLPATA
jgi:hypothetical protein